MDENIQGGLLDDLSTGEIIEGDSEVSEQSDNFSEEVVNDSEVSELENLDSTEEQSVLDDNQNLSELETEEESEEESTNPLVNVSENFAEDSPFSSVVEVVDNPDKDSGYDVVGLDVVGLNDMVDAYNEITAVQTVQPTSNDYYAFIDGDVLEYFADVMANYPMNEYRACHLRHWIQNTQYYSYYDDYYYLWFDYGHSLDYIELIKYNGQANWVVNTGNGNLLNASIMYGSEAGLADLRKGVSYVQEMALLCSVGVVLVLYICHAVFKHFVR